MESISFVLQARSGSTRLPNKMILPFYNGNNIFELLLEKLKYYFPQMGIILATSTDPNNDILEEIATSKNVKVFRGSENDVLLRFIKASEHYRIKRIIRICADNPFLDVSEIQRLLSVISQNKDIDYISFKVNNTPSIKTHFGFWAEYVTLNALKRVQALSSEPYYHEHVTNYIYENPQLFKLKFLDAPDMLIGRQDIRMTLDTKSDFQILSEIYTDLHTQNETFDMTDIITYLDNNPQYKKNMVVQIEQNSK